MALHEQTTGGEHEYNAVQAGREDEAHASRPQPK